jgi:hypothetical protein
VNFIQKRCLQSHETPKAPGGRAPKSVAPAAGRVWRRGGARRRQLTWVKAADRGVPLQSVAFRRAARAPRRPAGTRPSQCSLPGRAHGVEAVRGGGG